MKSETFPRIQAKNNEAFFVLGFLTFELKTRRKEERNRSLLAYLCSESHREPEANKGTKILWSFSFLLHSYCSPI